MTGRLMTLVSSIQIDLEPEAELPISKVVRSRGASLSPGSEETGDVPQGEGCGVLW